MQVTCKFPSALGDADSSSVMVAVVVFRHRLTLYCLAFVYFTVSVMRSGRIPLRWSDPCPPLILSSDIGRLGNKFFEYLASILMGQLLDREVYATIAFANLYDRYFTGRKALKLLSEGCSVNESRIVSLNFFTFDNLRPQDYADNTFIQTRGYPFHITTRAWQQIFQRRDELIQQFRWRPELKSAVERQIGELATRRKASVVVGIHVRMTDYYKYLVNFYGSYRQPDSAFFNKTMNYFRNKFHRPIFLVISNDLNWCKDHLAGDDIVYPSDGDEEDPGWDLAILASCDHLILTYGTFGYMSAWFKGPGEILVADNYTVQPEEMFERLKAANPPNWSYVSV